jgi:hypothetical protein
MVGPSIQYIDFYKKLITVIFSYRKLNFARCYTADISSIKHFLKPDICKNVRELDLTSCYWLKSVDIRRCVLKLSNLEALYVADTSISSSDLIKILQALRQVFIVAPQFLGCFNTIFEIHYWHQYRLSQSKNAFFLQL